MSEIISLFQRIPIIPLFLTVGLGFWLGGLRIKRFALGSVAATLVVGVIIGQMKIVIPDMVKNIFFMLFLFAIGYSVGPQFFRAFRGEGKKQALFAVVVAFVCSGLVLVIAKLMDYNNGIAAGLFAGSQTVSASLGLMADTVREMPLDEERRQYLLMIIPACYAVTYVFGTIGTSWFLSVVGPRMMGGLDKVKQEVAKIEQSLDNDNNDAMPGFIKAKRPIAFRCYQVSQQNLSTPLTVKELESQFNDAGQWVYIERLRVDGQIQDPAPQQVIKAGDHVVLGARAEMIVDASSRIGPEITDPELLNFGAEKVPVTVSTHGVSDITVEQLRAKPYMERVMIASIKRNGMSIPLKKQTVLHAGDVITIVGWPREVADAASHIGYADRQSDKSDMVFIGLGIAIGCILGALTITIKGIPVGPGLSVGVLISGLVLGWLRNKRPVFGRIPSSALWILNNLGINMFIAVIGITAGASFIKGIQEASLWLIPIGAGATIGGVVICIYIGRKLFKFSAPETLGCIAGARCCVAAQGAVVDTLQSDVPNLGYTVTYAVANIVLVFSSLLLLFLV